MSSIYKYLKDILAPKKCYGCKIQGHFLCLTCEKKLQKHNPICYVCKKPSDNFKTHDSCKSDFSLDQVLLYTRYNNMLISKLIKHGKFYHKRDIWEEIPKHYIELLHNHMIPNEKYVLVPVPMYFWKRSMRGYNQSELLVKNIAKQIDVSVEYHLIKKIKPTSQQSHLSRAKRKENLQGSLQVNKKLIDKYKHHTIILIDDVISTGTTLDEIATLVKNKGVHSVVGAVFASD